MQLKWHWLRVGVVYKFKALPTLPVWQPAQKLNTLQSAKKDQVRPDDIRTSEVSGNQHSARLNTSVLVLAKDVSAVENPLQINAKQLTWAWG
jgi:hypothetical protein